MSRNAFGNIVLGFASVTVFMAAILQVQARLGEYGTRTNVLIGAAAATASFIGAFFLVIRALRKIVLKRAAATRLSEKAQD